MLVANRILAILVAGSVTFIAGHGAGAATITRPSGNTTTARANVPLTVAASGFSPGVQVFVEQCDGVAPTAPSWSPTLHCDLGSSPPPAIADAGGNVVFSAAIANRAFVPFAGESPQSLFNCLPAGAPPLTNGLANFTRCQIRVSTNNTAITGDQVFFPLSVSPAPARQAPSGRPLGRPATRQAKGANAARSSTTSGAARSRPRTTAPAHNASAPLAHADVHASDASSRHGGAGLLGLSDDGVRTGYLLGVFGLAIAGLPALVHAIGGRRRKRRRGNETTANA